MPADLVPVFERLKSILEAYGARLHVTDDLPTSYGIDAAPEDERNPTTWIAGVRLGRRTSATTDAGVRRSLAAETVSPELKRHMQGKSCFNFSRIDESLFGELDALPNLGYERLAGDPAWGAQKRVEHGMAHRRAGSALEPKGG